MPPDESDQTRVKPWRDPYIRGLIAQISLVLLLGGLAVGAFVNAKTKIEAQHVPTGFGFLNGPAGFDINQTLIPYTNTSPIWRVFWVGLINTFVVSAIGVVLATLIGFAVGRGRLSKNWLIARLCAGYVESIRNVPLLLQLVFWAFVLTEMLPVPSQSLRLFDTFFLNKRGLFFPAASEGPGFWAFIVALVCAAGGSLALRHWARTRQDKTGKFFPVAPAASLMTIAFVLVAYLISGSALSFTWPSLTRFNISGGARFTPELAAMILGLGVYTGSFIAETVRSGFLSTPKGQHEAAAALGLPPKITRKLVIQPQAMRVIIPPLISQYLNLIKNSTLSVAIGYPDLFSVFAGTALNNTGATVQIILMTIAVYLSFSLITSFTMNHYNARMALRER